MSELQVFHWRIDFGHIILNGGFDVVIENPPYIRIHKQKKELKYFNKAVYYSAFQDYDIYVLFFERTIHLTKEDGVLGLITQDKFLIREYGSKLREILLEYSIYELFDISRATDIFDAATYPLMSFIKKTRDIDTNIDVRFAKTIENIDTNFDNIFIPQELCKQNNLIELVHPSHNKMLKKTYENSKPLSEVISKDQIFCGTPRAKDYHSWSKNIVNKKGSKDCLRMFVCANLSPYFIDLKKKVRTLGHVIEEPYFVYDKSNMSESKWEDFKFMPKILIRGNDTRITAVIDDYGSVFIGIYGIKISDNLKHNYKYLIALLNSKLYQWIFAIQNPSVRIGGGFFSINTPQLFKLPYREIDKMQLTKFNTTVDKILSITKSKDYSENKQKQHEIKKLQDEIDKLVYKHYSLTSEEIKVVEEFTSK